jgi:hypothetical protein
MRIWIQRETYRVLPEAEISIKLPEFATGSSPQPWGSLHGATRATKLN